MFKCALLPDSSASESPEFQMYIGGGMLLLIILFLVFVL